MVWGKRTGIAVVVVLACYGLGALVDATLIDYVVRVLLFCGINAILAVGLNLINGTTGQFSIGHAGFMAVGGYGTAFTVIQLENALAPQLAGLPPDVAHGIVLSVGIVVGALFAGAAGFLVGVPSLRLRGDYLAVVTLGFGEIIRLLFNNSVALGAATGYSGGRPMGLPTYTSFFWVFTWAAIVIAVITSLTRSRYGRALAQIREDEISAEAMGLPTTRLKVTAFVVSSMAAGVAGGLFAHLQGGVRPDDFKFDKSIDVIVMVIVGGLGSISGAVLGAVVITVLLEALHTVDKVRLIVYPLLLIFTMLLRPQGMLGRREIPFRKSHFGEMTDLNPTPAVSSPEGTPILSVERVVKVFGGLKAINDVSFSVSEKQIFGLIGPNGAGKTTIFNVVTGVYVPDGGDVRFLGQSIRGWKPFKIARLGIGRTFQNIRIAGEMSVLDNVLVASFHHAKSGVLGAVFRTARYDAEEYAARKKAIELLEVFGLLEQKDEDAGSLPYGSQRRLEIVRAMMLDPKLILLDEPAAGLNSSEADKLKEQIRWLRDTFGLAVVLVEHNMHVVMGVCDHVHCVDHGETIAEGTPDEVRNHPEVLKAYLGEEVPSEPSPAVSEPSPAVSEPSPESSAGRPNEGAGSA